MIAGGFRLDDRTAMVTGAGRGIGRACALALAEAGADIVAVSRSSGELETLVRDIERRGGSAKARSCDVTDGAGVRRLVDSLERVDVLVGSAGTNIPEPLVEVTEDHLDGLLALNVKATFMALQAVARRMLATGTRGSIVTISSQMGHVGAANRSLYCTTKHAVEGMTKAAAVELAPHGIRVNTVAPTFVETSMTAPYFADENFRSEVERSIPLGRIGAVDDVTGAVLYLASSAAALVTGTSLLVDGGWTAR